MALETGESRRRCSQGRTMLIRSVKLDDRINLTHKQISLAAGLYG